MPFTHFICETTGERVDPQDCLACALGGALPGCQMTPAILAGILRHQRPADFAMTQAQAALDGKPVTLDKALTVTELLGCPRKTRLMKTVDWADRPARLYWAYRGTLFHDEAEKYAATEPLAFAEGRLHWVFKFQGQVVSLSGQPDLMLYRAGAWHLLDYKTIREVPRRTWRHTCRATGQVIYDSPFRANGKGVNCPHCGVKHTSDLVEIREMPPQPRGSHIEQLQLYTLLIEKNGPQLLAALNDVLASIGGAPLQQPPAVNTAELHYLDMSGGLRIPVDVWPLEQRMTLLKARLALHLLDDPEPIRDPQEAWQCDYCPVRAACELRQGAPVGRAALMTPQSETEAA